MRTEQEIKTLMNKTIEDKKSLMKRTKTIRMIKYFPNNSNQQQTKILCYNEHGNIINSMNSTYTSINQLQNILPKRIGIIEDHNFITKQADFKYFDHKQEHLEQKKKRYPFFY